MNTTWTDVDSWVRSQAPESDVLEFKAAFWQTKDSRPASEEIAKDVAALMNNRGGVLCVGIREAGGRAAGFPTADLPTNADQTVQQALSRHLSPSEAAATVRTSFVAGADGATQRSVLVVDVPGWPHGPVAVRSDAGAYRLPVRRGAHTEELAWEVAMREMASSHRRDWLRFLEWKDTAAEVGVVIGSSIRVTGPDGVAFTLPVHAVEPFARLVEVGPDAVTLRVIRTEYARQMAALAALKKLPFPEVEPMVRVLGGSLLSGLIEGAWHSTNATRALVVPYELVRAAWLQRLPNGTMVHLLIDADLIFAGDTWVLRPAPR